MQIKEEPTYVQKLDLGCSVRRRSSLPHGLSHVKLNIETLVNKSMMTCNHAVQCAVQIVETSIS